MSGDKERSYKASRAERTAAESKYLVVKLRPFTEMSLSAGSTINVITIAKDLDQPQIVPLNALLYLEKQVENGIDRMTTNRAESEGLLSGEGPGSSAHVGLARKRDYPSAPPRYLVTLLQGYLPSLVRPLTVKTP